MIEQDTLKETVIEKIKEVFDPEIPVNIWDLGLIYEVNVLPINNVQVVMTLTAPSCPAIQLADSTSPGVPGTRSGAAVARSAAIARAAIASNAGGSGGSGAPPGDSSVNRATSSASAATSHESR